MKIFSGKFLGNIFLILILGFSLFSCKKVEPENSAQYLYYKAFEMLKDKDYMMAGEAFEKIDEEFPLSKWAIKGKVMAIYCNYKLNEYDKIIQITDDFIRAVPNSEYNPYVLYMKSLAFYHKIPSIERAQDYTKEASYAFRELIARYPDSEYSVDAKSKLDFVDEHLAGSRMSIARYQMSVENYIGAIKNLNHVITRQGKSNQVPEAYFRLAEIYFRIGFKDFSTELALALQEKYPRNYWSKEVQKYVNPN